HAGVRPFVVSDGDAAVAAAQDRLDDHRVAEGLDVAFALQLGLVGIDAARDVDRQRQRQVDLLLVLSIRRKGEEETYDNETQQLGHEATPRSGADDQARTIPPVGSPGQPRAGLGCRCTASLCGKIAGGNSWIWASPRRMTPYSAKGGAFSAASPP